MLILSFDPVYCFKEYLEIFFIINKDIQSNCSVAWISLQSFKVMFFKSFEVFEMTIKGMINYQTFIDKSILNCDKMLVNEISRFFVDLKHKF